MGKKHASQYANFGWLFLIEINIVQIPLRRGGLKK